MIGMHSFLLVCIALFYPLESSAATTTGGSAQVDCELDAAMKAQMDAVAAAERAERDNDANTVASALPVKEAACMPFYEDMDRMIRTRIPDLSNLGGDLLSKIKGYACRAGNSYLESVARQASTTVSDPYGIISVGVGVGAGSDQHQTYDPNILVESTARQVINRSGGMVRSETNQVINEIPNNPVDRKPSIGSEISEEINDALNGL